MINLTRGLVSVIILISIFVFTGCGGAFNIEPKPYSVKINNEYSDLSQFERDTLTHKVLKKYDRYREDGFQVKGNCINATINYAAVGNIKASSSRYSNCFRVTKNSIERTDRSVCDTGCYSFILSSNITPYSNYINKVQLNFKKEFDKEVEKYRIEKKEKEEERKISADIKAEEKAEEKAEKAEEAKKEAKKAKEEKQKLDLELKKQMEMLN